jgi:hypothetical protein
MAALPLVWQPCLPRGNGLEFEMKVASDRIDLYRSLYWANQGLLNAAHALHQAETPISSLATEQLNQELRRTQAIIEETRAVMNHILREWIEREE